ncbi:MAG TPA: RNA polymerase sigma factor, partial [Solirubrobacterales bacterium]|nr:RNA polymerase sigma factor [Solirubrobacterales bacterium]
MHTQTDERLVALARRGKERAFDEIVRRYRPGLVAFAAAYRPPDPEDVVQESLVRAWTALRDSTGDMHLKAGLYTIVRNRALNARRDTRVHEELPAEIDGVRQPSEIVLTNEELDRVVGVVAALPDAQREALVRSALEGHTHEQIAASLGSTEGAVRQLIYRARVAVRHGVGFVLPLPLVALLIEAGAGAAGGAAVAGGGASLATKIAAVAAIGAVAIGSGVAIERSRDSRSDERQSNQTRQVREARTNQPAAAQVASSSGSEGTGEDSGSGGSGSSRGPGGGDDDRGEGSDDSGSSSGEGPDDSGGSGSSGSGSDDDSSGSGSAGTAVDDDSSGSGSANSGHGSENSGPGSTSSGSGSGGSGSSGSG